MQHLELFLLALALLLSTINIFVYAWFAKELSYLNIGIWIIRITGALPSLIFSLWALYALATAENSQLGAVLLIAGLLLAAGSVQLLSLLVTKQAPPPGGVS